MEVESIDGPAYQKISVQFNNVSEQIKLTLVLLCACQSCITYRNQQNGWTTQECRMRIHLSKIKKQYRLLWTEQYVTWKNKLKCMILSDENKFNFAGPDVWNGY